MKRILFLGQKKIGERCFEILLQRAGGRYVVAGTCSNRGTDVWWQSNNVYTKARSLKIPLISNDKRHEDEIMALIKTAGIDTLLSVQHSWILSQKMLSTVRHNALNLHNAKLPDYKGYYTINHAIINGDPTYTSTIHWMLEAVDAGAIAFEETVRITADDTAISLYEKACDAGVRAFERLVESFVNSEPIPRTRLEGAGRFYAKSDLDTAREIANPDNIEEMNRKARALFFPPSEPAFYRRAGKKIFVLPEDYQAYVSDAETFLAPFVAGKKPNFIINPRHA